jgi:hypothetical protein
LTITFKDGVARGFSPFSKDTRDGWYQFDEENNWNIFLAYIRPAPGNNFAFTGSIRGRVTSPSGTWVAAPDFNMDISSYLSYVCVFQSILLSQTEAHKHGVTQ